MAHVLGSLFLVFSLLSPWQVHSAPSDVGIVLLHGKQGSPDVTINELASALLKAGYLVVTPTCAWSKSRIYDTSVEGSLEEIDREVKALRDRGAKKIVVAGQSLGGNVAIRYAATRAGLAGVVALAPAHNPDSAAARRLFSQDLARARKLIAEQKGDQTERFLDADASRTFSVVVTPKQYLSWWGEEDGDLLMPRNAGRIPASVPLLYVVGNTDPLTRPKEEVFDKAPVHPLSKYLVVSARHLEVPSAATQNVLAWIGSLPE